MRRHPILLLVLVLLAACATRPPGPPAPAPLILISLDGFRPDYLDRGATPTLSRLAAQGALGRMRPSFPSKTFPNHYTLVTGLRPDRHGVVENNMEDPGRPGVTFKMSNRPAVADRFWWDGGEPVWVTAERAGVRTAPMFWPGSEAEIRGVRPSYWRPYHEPTPFAARVDQLLAWLNLPPEQRPRFLTFYAHQPDTAGHDHGPDSPALQETLREVDAAVGRLVAGLEARGLAANLVVVSDHGMAPVSLERRVFLDDFVPKGAYRALAGGAFATIYPAPGREAEVERALLGRRDHFACWRKSEIPARFGYGSHPRVAPIFCLPDTGWSLTTRDYRPPKPEHGAHGYDPASPEMAAVFIGHGPAFRRGVRVADFDNVDVYPLLMRLLALRPAPHEGDLSELSAALR